MLNWQHTHTEKERDTLSFSFVSQFIGLQKRATNVTAHSPCSPYVRWCMDFFLVQICVFCSLFVILYCGFRLSMYYDSRANRCYLRRSRRCRRFRRRCLALSVLMFALFCWCWCHCCCCYCCWLLLFWFRFAYSHIVLVYIRVYFCVKQRIVVYFLHSSNLFFFLVFVCVPLLFLQKIWLKPCFCVFFNNEVSEARTRSTCICVDRQNKTTFIS